MQINGAELLQTLNSSPCLIWLPMRLGINELNPSYIPVVKALLSTHLAVGIGGGRPKSSYYFFGFIDNDLLYLDPHVTRAAVQAKRAEDLTEEDLQSYQAESVKRMPITAIDPCFVACYLLKDVSDYESFVNFIADLKDFNGQNLISLRSPDQIDVESRIIADTDDDFLEIS
jgi:cysteine protease ATG4